MRAPLGVPVPAGAGTRRNLSAERRAAIRRYVTFSRTQAQTPAQVDPRFLLGLDHDQAMAVALAAAPGPGALAVTGEAGSGKTLMLSRLAQALEAQGRRLVVTAVTHQALYVVRSRLVGTRTRTVTLARVLRSRFALTGASVVVIEEASMLSDEHLYAVLGSLESDARLVLMGDPAQLPAISPGEPFREAIASGLPTVRLRGQYRQGAGSGVREFVTAVREGRVPERLPAGVSLHYGLADPVERLVGVVRAARRRGRLPLVVTWLRDDWVDANLALQGALNPQGTRVARVAMPDSANVKRWVELRVGDRVTCNLNVPAQGIYNGLTGVILGDAGGPLRVRTDAGRYVNLPAGSLELGYCLTVHRAQGGEWDHVVVYQPAEVRKHAREWHYTAVSRARVRLDVLTGLDRDALWRNVTGRAVRN